MARSSKAQYEEMERRTRSALESTWLEYGYTFDNIFGVDKCTDMLIENIVQPFRFPHLYSKPMRTFTLFGVPGSGKTHLLAAAASASGANLFVLNAWLLQSRRMADIIEPTNSSVDDFLKTVFKIVRDNSPSILCFEEIEVFSKGGLLDTAKTSFINEMQNFLQNPQDIWDLVVVVGISQEPWNVDSSVREMFSWSPASHVTLPNAEARVKVLETYFEDVPHTLGHEQFTDLASRSTGFTGCDMKILARYAHDRAGTRLSEATHFKKILVKNKSDVKNKTNSKHQSGKSLSGKRNSDSTHSTSEGETEYDEKFVPCSADDAGAMPLSVFDLPSDKIQIGDVTMNDMEEELIRIRPIDTADVEKMSLFEAEYCAL